MTDIEETYIPPPPPLLVRSYKAICLKCNNICDTHNPLYRYKSYCFNCSRDNISVLTPLVVQ